MNPTLLNASEPRAAGIGPSDEWALGAILVDFHCMNWPAVHAVLQEQSRTGEIFGQVAVRLGMIRAADLDKALARQFRTPKLGLNEGSLNRDLVIIAAPDSQEANAIRRLRAALLHRCFSSNMAGKSLVIASAGKAEGKSYVAANLAASFAQLGKRTLLVDGDLRRGRQHEIFGIGNVSGLSTMLAGRSGDHSIQRIGDNGELGILPRGPNPPHPEEMTSQSGFRSLIASVCNDFDVVLIDTPPLCDGTDVQSMAATAGAALVVAHRHRTRALEMTELLAAIQIAGASIVGSVMNSFSGKAI